ncbi:MAG: VWA domain-containing protein [Anaerolineae bacterium]|nr:VWA domain-containing protein [Anaerolineae bacterium]
MVEHPLWLYQIFDYLRRHGVPLGISEYLDAVETVRDGVMLDDPAHLKRLCRLLWAKSLEDQELVEVAFAHFVEPRLRQALTSKPSTPLPESAAWESEAKSLPVDLSFLLKPTTPPSFQLEFDQVVSRTMPLDMWPVEVNVSGRPYQLTPRYPIGMREMATAWRHMRKLQRSGPPEVLDVEATLHDICRTGIFLRPALRPRRRNQARLVLLIDQGGSMTPFAPLVGVLVNSIQRGGLLGRVTCFYFHDCPEGFLYTQPTLTGAQSLGEILQTQVGGAGVLIVSDAGAARGYYDGQRLQITRTFLKMLSTYTYTYVWLNPLPSSRWVATTAEDIVTEVPMFPLSRDGLNDAVTILRGHPFPPGVSNYGRKNT